jgi:hypothetical protein
VHELSGGATALHAPHELPSSLHVFVPELLILQSFVAVQVEVAFGVQNVRIVTVVVVETAASFWLVAVTVTEPPAGRVAGAAKVPFELILPALADQFTAELAIPFTRAEQVDAPFT